MFDSDNEQDDFFSNNGFGQQDFSDDSADFFSDSGNFEDSFSDNNTEIDFFGTEDQEVLDNQQVEETSSLPVVEPRTNFGYKTVGIVIALGLVIIAFILLSISNMDIVEKDSSNTQQVNLQTQNTKPTQGSTQNNQNTQVQSGTTNLVNIPPNTSIDYSGSILTAQGVVSALNKYLQDGQVIYCIELNLSLGTSSTTVHYYCGYNVFKQVSIGEMLTVQYQQVSNSCFSVCTITK